MLAQVPWEWNDTTVPFRNNECIHQLFEQQVAVAPDAVCLAFEGTYMTFADVNHRANQLARHLCTVGVATDVAVAVLMERSFDLIIAMMGMQSKLIACVTMQLSARLVSSCCKTHACLKVCLIVYLILCHKGYC